MSNRREFLTKSLGFVGVGIGAIIASKVSFDPSKGLGIAKSTTENNEDAKAYAMCGMGMNCSGGGGQCGMGMNCSGGGGQCGMGMNCGGG